jgi:hypothetical protein
MWVTPELVAEAVSPEAGMIWAQWASDPKDVTREFSITIQAGSTGERAKSQRVKQAQERVSTFIEINGALIAQGGVPAYDLVEAGLDLLKANGERNPDKYLLPPPPPMPAPAQPNMAPPDQAAAAGVPVVGEPPAEMLQMEGVA